ncbi:transposon protein, putative, CACTA, En/Spm sub-class [Panicum miliaceum]|uniref:Transposon protein, putative, CACTA, En/Spm sub-class n=1 Tax=Panicum miliaceum TaxID=4540 RepID=A0A3L6T7E4_PANMI|nr:transposon protein, putative, CACTA, En/Spm sub-class [Panicum miliaceum]
MDGAGEEAERILMDAINECSTSVYENYGEEEARTTDSFLNFFGDGIAEEQDDGFTLMHEQPVRSDNPIEIRPDNDDDGDFGGPSSTPLRAPSSPSPARARSTPTPPAPAKGKKKTSSLPPAGTPGPKKRKVVVKKIGPNKKLEYELSGDELDEHVRERLDEHFKPRPPEKRVRVDPATAENVYNCLRDVPERPVKLRSDYDRTLIKAH